MPVRTIYRLCMSENEEHCSKGLRWLARELGTDSVTNEPPPDFEEKRGQFADKGLHERILALAVCDNEVHRELAVAALGSWLSDEGRDVILKATEADEEMIRATAIGALEGWPDSEEAYEILLLAIDEPKWSVRMQAARALRPYPGSDADQALLMTLLDPNANVRYTAGESLRHRDRDVVLPKLRDLFDHPAAHVFDAGLDLLGEIGTVDDMKVLNQIGSLFNFSQPGHVRKWARDAARKIKVRLAAKN